MLLRVGQIFEFFFDLDFGEHGLDHVHRQDTIGQVLGRQNGARQVVVFTIIVLD